MGLDGSGFFYYFYFFGICFVVERKQWPGNGR